MLAKIEKSGEPLDELCRTRQLSKTGCDWLKKALDPFHDFELHEFEGFPDGGAENSVLYNVQSQQTISVPAGHDGLWDCHIALLPVDSVRPHNNTFCAEGAYVIPYGVGSYNGAGKVVSVTSEDGYAALGGLSIQSVPANTPTFRGDTKSLAEAAGGWKESRLDTTSYLSTEAGVPTYRIAAAGFEVVNTTATIAKQGDVTCYHMPTYPSNVPYEVYSTDQTTFKYDGSVEIAPPHNSGLANGYTFRSPPNELEDAKQTPGARTWAAQDGVYVPARMHTENRYSSLGKHDWTMITHHDDTSGKGQDITVQGMGHLFNRVRTESDAGLGFLISCPVSDALKSSSSTSHISNYDISGAYFSGLSKETSLTVTLRMTIELIPGANDRSRLALARPSAPLDVNALALYTEVTRLMPPGVPVGYNDAGKWFRMILSKVRVAASAAMPYLPAIEAALVAAGRPGAAAMIAAAEQQVRNQKKKQNNTRKQRAVPNFGPP